ncbi:conserved hypothetical protein [Histoplasma mississippiense (nom. inval.)]|uniref:conserved hypothetical protein n=1 Tax=Ajellomyces capsulatus (strain NAm1 / WU24) TaxID=2059318 RepID=UPI000157CF08|nr:conserved hypothetical protein [Histoplasma mississippiense (nom. inval.)]EDN04383.1 conserved hypothetical protein [Histoplasma mississippiense (nom. inval.)]
MMGLDLLVSLLALSVSPCIAATRSPLQIPVLDTQPIETGREFTLRHMLHHGTYRDPLLHKRLDIRPDTLLWAASENGEKRESVPRFRVSSRPINIHRLSDRHVSVVEDYLSIARMTSSAVTLSSDYWTLDEVDAPDVTDKETVLSLAKMTSNAYIMIPGSGEWFDVVPPFNHSDSFGWDSDGLRGHIYSDNTNSTIVVVLKACVRKALRQENRYYRAALNLYSNITAMYPQSNIWVTGHSLGGAVSSLLGMTYGLPVVTFEAVPEALPASRLGLPPPPGTDPSSPQARNYTGAYHFGHTADPIYMGTCNGATSWKISVGELESEHIESVKMRGLQQLEVFRKQRNDTYAHYHHYEHFNQNKNVNLQDSRVVGMLGSHHDSYYNSDNVDNVYIDLTYCVSRAYDYSDLPSNNYCFHDFNLRKPWLIV